MSVIVKTNDLLTDDLNIATIDLYSDLTFLVSGLKGDKGDPGLSEEEHEELLNAIEEANRQARYAENKGDVADEAAISAGNAEESLMTYMEETVYPTMSRADNAIKGAENIDVVIEYEEDDSAYLYVKDRNGVWHSSTRLNGPKGDKGDKGDAGTTDYNELINKPTIPNKVSQLENDSKYTTEKYVDDKIAEVETFKTPNITIYGQPTINNGQISNFSATNYAQFPFMVNFQNRPFNIHICLTTSNDITTQQNIFDSRFGLAFAIRNKHLICAYSTNGTSWESELIGSHELKANTTYYINLKWQDNKFGVYLSEDHEIYLQDIDYSVNATPASKQIIIGKDFTNNYVFGGIVNLNYCYLTIGEDLIWQGMDDVGLSTRLATDLSNIDDEGIEKIKEIVSRDYLEMTAILDDGTMVKYRVYGKEV